MVKRKKINKSKKKKVVSLKKKFLIGRQKLKRIIVSLFVTFFICLWVLFGLLSVIREEKIVNVEKGEGLSVVSYELKEQGVVYSQFLFKVLMYVTFNQDKVQAGEYVFNSGESLWSIKSKLIGGRTYQRFVTVPEGLTVKQIFEILEKDKNLTGKITVKVKDGDLLPNTYGYGKGATRDQVILEMKDAMTVMLDNLWKAYQSKDLNSPVKTKEQLLVLASIVEKETGIASERPMVASVFINRLKKGMKLQTDPTVVYAITDGYGSMKGRRLWSKYLEVDNPYNTYKYKGLPPGPIANPGEASLKAVLQSANTNYLFFVADGTGGHVFAATLEEHEKNREKWREVRKTLQLKK